MDIKIYPEGYRKIPFEKPKYIIVRKNQMLDKLNLKQKIIIGIIIIVIVIAIGIYGFISMQKEETVINLNEMLISENEEQLNNETNETEEVNNIVVHITGEVKKAGILTLPEGARIADAIEVAGGATNEADLDSINLAYVLEDGQKIYIPSIHDIEEKEIIQENQEEIFGKENETGKVNINTAKQTELETLPGIGPTIALRIIEYRKENGEFTDIEELKEVEGIGEAKWEQIKDFVEI